MYHQKRNHKNRSISFLFFYTESKQGEQGFFAFINGLPQVIYRFIKFLSINLVIKSNNQINYPFNNRNRVILSDYLREVMGLVVYDLLQINLFVKYFHIIYIFFNLNIGLL